MGLSQSFDFFLNQIIEIAEKNGFGEIILPSIEPSQIYVDKAGNEILDQMYVFEDRANRELCLRPEVTATVQLVGEKFYRTKKDVKLWYFEKCYRYERPQKGRYREFYQFGLEVINPSIPFSFKIIAAALTIRATKPKNEDQESNKRPKEIADTPRAAQVEGSEKRFTTDLFILSTIILFIIFTYLSFSF